MIPTNRHLPPRPLSPAHPQPVTPAHVTAWLNARERRELNQRRLNWLLNFALGAVGLLVAFQIYLLFFEN